MLSQSPLIKEYTSPGAVSVAAETSPPNYSNASSLQSTRRASYSDLTAAAMAKEQDLPTLVEENIELRKMVPTPHNSEAGRS